MEKVIKVFSGHQPNFLPYMGFFYKMLKSDVFVLDDDVQYSNDAFHNMNFLKLNVAKCKIIVPVSYSYGDAINKVKIAYVKNWDKKLLKSIRMNYARAEYVDVGYELIERHLNKRYEHLSDMNISLIKEIAERFGIVTNLLVASRDVPTNLKNNQRNIYQCLRLGCNVYYSGIGGKAYNDDDCYKQNGIEIVYTDYSPVVYKQNGKDFIENLSVLDYICNNGFNLPEGWHKNG